MGRSNRKRHQYPSTKSHTLPSTPTHSTSSSSSDFEFTISLSPHKSSSGLCPADDLFYKGQLLPLHHSPRLSMVRTLLLSPSSSDATTTASRDSTASSHSSSDDLLLLHHHLDSDSSRPSSITDEEFKRLPYNPNPNPNNPNAATTDNDIIFSRKSSKYFSLSKFSSVFRKENRNATPSGGGAAVERVSSTAKEVLRKYLRKVKPLYEKLSQKRAAAPPPAPPPSWTISRSANATLCLMRESDQEFMMTGVNYANENANKKILQSFSGNLRYPRRRSSYISSCPSSMMSSPRHGESGFGQRKTGRPGPGLWNSDASSMEELQSAIQGAIAHCKNSMMKNKNTVSNEI